MEGPSLFLAQEQLRPFVGKKILNVSGNTTIAKERFEKEQVTDIFSWGKHLLFQCETFGLKVHFLLFGTFSAEVNGVRVTGDYKKARVPRLAFTFTNGTIEMYNCSVKIIEDAHIKDLYDFSVDVLSATWNPKKALAALQEQTHEEIADVLLDQNIFAGVGNIIKNEILSLAYTNPKQTVGSLSLEKQKELIGLARSFSQQFYAWRKEFLLLKTSRSIASVPVLTVEPK